MTHGIGSPELGAVAGGPAGLAASYAACRRLNAVHGRSYYLATLLLPAARRPAVHALYGFARYADEIVDDLDSTLSPAAKAAWLASWGEEFLTDLRTGAGRHEITAAVVDTIRRYDIPVALFEDFLAAMTMDLTVTGYATYADLESYMHGSAGVIGLQLLPVFGTVSPQAPPYAHALGVAFQLTNFLRDIGEDLRRGRVYLPEEDLDRFGVRRADLAAPPTPAVKKLLEFEIDRVRALYRAAEPGIDLLEPASRPCVRTAFALYGRILDEIVKADFEIHDRRVSVGLARRVAIAGPELWRARRLRR